MFLEHSYGSVAYLVTGAANATSAAPIQYNLADLFLPETGGHQPYGFDQMTPLYKRFKVRRVCVHIEAQGPTGGAFCTLFAAFTSPTAGFSYVSASPVSVSEQPGVVARICPNAVPIQFERTVDIHTLVGVTKQEYESDLATYVGTGAASPTLSPKLILCVSSPTATQSAYVNVRLTFQAEWFDRITQAGS